MSFKHTLENVTQGGMTINDNTENLQENGIILGGV
jgi:hypothetical protein